MDGATIVAFGMFLVAAAAVSINVFKAKRESKKDDIRESASVIEAKAGMRLGSIEAAERVVAMYGAALAELQKRVAYLEQKLSDLEIENERLEEELRRAKYKLHSHDIDIEDLNILQAARDKTVQDILHDTEQEQRPEKHRTAGERNEQTTEDAESS